MLKRIAPEAARLNRNDPVDAVTLAKAAEIVQDVRENGEPALRRHAEKLGDLLPGAPLVLEPADLRAALERLPASERGVLERTAERIAAFATAQRNSIQPIEVAVPGGFAGHQIAPMERAGCYAPGGRFPLPSSVLMTAVTARVAGVREVWVASPRPVLATQAAAAVAGADALLCVGGAQAIAALTYGAGVVPACDAVVGPGNRWVTAAKQLVAGRVAIDMLAGPSELVVLADMSADADAVAADLLAQAEHDPDASACLVTINSDFADAVDAALAKQLATLPTAETARAALAQSFCVVAPSLDVAVDVCNALAPEHLEVTLQPSLQARAVDALQNWGALFIGGGAAEVFGDYGIGPNHVLPTSGGARLTGGLSVLNFVRVRTYLKGHPTEAVIRDAAALARMEGLEGHARAAEQRLPRK